MEQVDVEQNKDIEQLQKDTDETKEGLKAHVDDCAGWRHKVMDKIHSLEKKGYWAFGILVLLILASQSEKVQNFINLIL